MAPATRAIDLDDIGFVKRVAVGSVDPNNPLSDEQAEKQVELLNKCIGPASKGRILTVEKSFGVYYLGEHRLELEKVVYHIGWKRKPNWIEGG